MPNREDIYRDTGCEVSPSCLRCPLPVCKYDLPKHQRPEAVLEERSRKHGRRAQEIAEGYRGGESVEELAARFGVSVRTVYRALSREE